MRLKRHFCAAVFVLACFVRAAAHDGPPYAVLVDQKLGPSVASVWADPDVGTGTFFIILEPAEGETLPADIEVGVGVQPVGGRLAEAVHAAARDEASARVQYKAEVPFDAEGQWHVRVLLRSSGGGGELATDVEVTPPGLGRWDLLIYLFPFAAVAVLWLRAFLAKRGRRKGVQT